MQKWVLRSTVFVSGMLVMILELMGTRMIAPYFGSSLHVWTGMIGTILGFLSLGYYIGGRLADRNASIERLGMILLCNAICCFILVFSARYILTYLASTVLYTSFGALLATVFLFSIPSVLFGIVSPYAMKLQLDSLKSSGTTVGNLYALGTIGSIMGTFLAGYYLFSIMGSFQITFMISVILLINAAILLKRKILQLIGMMIIAIVWYALQSSQLYIESPDGNEILAVEHTAYSDYFIHQSEEDGATVRMLLTDFLATQSKYKMGHSDEIITAYARFYTLPQCYALNNRVLLIGGGAFTYPRYYASHFPEGQMDVVEIDPELTRISQQYFELAPDTARFDIINEDGRTYLNKNQKQYEAILVDAYASTVPPFQLTTKEAFEKMYESLDSQGVLILNVLSFIDETRPTLVDVEMKTAREVFDNVHLYQVTKGAPRDKIQGYIIVAVKGKAHMKSTCLVTDNGLLSNLIDYQLKDTTRIFTDNYAPVESVIY